MAFELKMPKLGESVTEGTIGKWLKQPGDKVNKYDLLVEVQTDKVNTEIPSPIAGTLKEVKVEEGQTVPIGTLLAIFDTADREAAAQPTAAQPPKPSQPGGPQPSTGLGTPAGRGFPRRPSHRNRPRSRRSPLRALRRRHLKVRPSVPHPRLPQRRSAPISPT
jgi:pyruvate/2-oxoglutarate dehydrogenase complex dihydrolipoamide acyltransferase (E2) component